MMKQRGFQLINPTEKWFPGLMEIRDTFSAWNWCYGKTPKFTVQKELQLKSDEKDHNVQLMISVDAVSFHLKFPIPNQPISSSLSNNLNELILIFHRQGLIEDISLVIPNYEAIPVVSTFKGMPYCEEHLNNIIMALKGVSTDNVEHAMNHSL